MPIKLFPPKGARKSWYARGTYIRVRIDRSTGARDRKNAQRIVGQWKHAIERGEFSPKEEPQSSIVTFAMAAAAYLKADGSPAHLTPILQLTGPHSIVHRPIEAIDQLAIDTIAAALYPGATAATRNRQVYTPIISILHHAGRVFKIKRPKGWRGKQSQSWLRPPQAFALIDAAYDIDDEFGLFCVTLLYTGMRLSEALRITLSRCDLDRRTIYLPRTKNSEPRAVHLPPIVIEALRTQPPRPVRPRRGDGPALTRGTPGRSRIGAGVAFLDRPMQSRLFRFHAGGHLRSLLRQAMTQAGLSFPRREGGFHIFCHTYGTWMDIYGELDTYGLVGTTRWKDPRSAARYRHAEPNEQARRSDRLPTPPRDADQENTHHAGRSIDQSNR